ncbi:hypothetical protein SB00610_02110 [Klebsiella quasipneumoniae subsp. similipneumoniae]|nr:hypothetical protein SB00610_02110 [Klebsiella quasipneumoniae subsp. similipneumoniae]
MHQRAGQRQPLLIAERQLVGGVAGNAVQTEGIAHAGDFVILRPAAQAVDAGEKAQVLLDAEVAVQRKFLRHIAQMLTRLAGADLKIHPQHQRFAGGGHQQAAHHFEGGGFTGAVLTHQRHHPARIDIQRGAGERLDARERFIDPFQLQ